MDKETREVPAPPEKKAGKKERLGTGCVVTCSWGGKLKNCPWAGPEDCPWGKKEKK